MYIYITKPLAFLININWIKYAWRKILIYDAITNDVNINWRVFVRLSFLPLDRSASVDQNTLFVMHFDKHIGYSEPNVKIYNIDILIN